MTPQRRKPARKEWAAAFASFRAGEGTAPSLSAGLGVSRSTFYRRFQIEQDKIDLSNVSGPNGTVDVAALAARMTRLIARSMSALEKSVASGRTADQERAARALSIQARMLAGLQKLQAAKEEDHGGDDTEPPPRSLPELRDELRRHLERIREEERSRAVPEEPDAG